MLPSQYKKYPIIQITNAQIEKIHEWCSAHNDLPMGDFPFPSAIFEIHHDLTDEYVESLVPEHGGKAREIAKEFIKMKFQPKTSHILEWKDNAFFLSTYENVPGKEEAMRVMTGTVARTGEDNPFSYQITYLEPQTSQIIADQARKKGLSHKEECLHLLKESIRLIFMVAFYINNYSEIKTTMNKREFRQTHTKKRQKKKPSVQTITRTIYSFSSIGERPVSERNYERHTFSWDVRGHWRTLKSGEKIWVRPRKVNLGENPHDHQKRYKLGGLK